jgi:hypothetical protein
MKNNDRQNRVQTMHWRGRLYCMHLNQEKSDNKQQQRHQRVGSMIHKVILDVCDDSIA